MKGITLCPSGVLVDTSQVTSPLKVAVCGIKCIGLWAKERFLLNILQEIEKVLQNEKVQTFKWEKMAGVYVELFRTSESVFALS